MSCLLKIEDYCFIKSKDNQNNFSPNSFGPFLDPIRGTADSPGPEAVSPEANSFTAVAAFLIFDRKRGRSTAPVPNAAPLLGNSSTANSTAIYPPTITTNALTHGNLIIKLKIRYSKYLGMKNFLSFTLVSKRFL